MSETPEQKLERSRLVDHFKRAYQIVVGLSITIACTKLFPDQFITFPLDASFWLFCTFFVTVVPIFHGGDRSLDIKYLHDRPAGFGGHAGYVWDVYMLLITAIFFVKIAQSVPGPQDTRSTILCSHRQTSPRNFYLWMGSMLIFDAIVLVIDGIRRLIVGGNENRFAAYIPWVLMNATLGAVCILAAHLPSTWSASTWPSATIAFLVFVVALLRTILDYVLGHEFLFP
ncbi:hypothetical protein ACQR16_05945 [Bradyrhizobium oligotrophicum]|uniref:hypothetical protein n=1 Tax=Bradyrhizobium oligotrophicum TaxID=44255 RepID=UPI003EBD333A